MKSVILTRIVKLVLLYFVTTTLSFCAKDRNTNEDESSDIKTYNYKFDVPKSETVFMVLLDSLNSEISEIGKTPEWLKVLSHKMENGHPVLELQTLTIDPSESFVYELTIICKDKSVAKLNFCQGILITGKDNGDLNREFIENWEDQNTVWVTTSRSVGFEKVTTPWSDNVAETTLPRTITSNIKKEDGWEMVFCILTAEGTKDMNYFGLYNRYLGILRVFYYVADASIDANEFSYYVGMGHPNSSNKSMFYSALNYAIPTSCQKINVTSIGNRVGSYITPYGLEVASLQRGWLAFDINCSSYTPEGYDWKVKGDHLSFALRTIRNQTVSLNGTLQANISGSFSADGVHSASSSGGISETMSSLKNTDKDAASVVASIWDKGMSYSRAVKGAFAIYNFSSSIHDYLLHNKYNNEVLDSLPGKIELSLSGKLKLDGYISSFVSHNIAPAEIGGTSIFTNTTFGTGGVWSLNDAPEILIASECFMGTQDRFNLLVGDNNTYTNLSVGNYDLRMISFLDPRSIKLNINTKVFPGISEVDVTYSYGTYINAEDGHTKEFRNYIQMEPTKRVEIVNRDLVSTGSLYRSSNSDVRKGMIYVQIKPSEIAESGADTVSQHQSNYKYFGVVNKESGAVRGNQKEFIEAPQIYFPMVKNGTNGHILHAGIIPDFVVCVAVTFKAGGKTYMFSQRYLPKYKFLSNTELVKHEKELKEYSDACKAFKPINSVVNNSAIPVTHKYGDESVKYTLKMLNEVVSRGSLK